MSLRSGDVLDDRYTLLDRLGQGGQGSVWKAVDKNTGADRALQIIDLHDQDDESAERARREARLVKDARHPGLVACHSLFEIPAENLLVLVFDFVKAAPLAEAIGEARFDRAHKLAALRHIAGALAYLHRIGLVHRALEPDNVLVTPLFWEDPAAPSGLKLIDLGIAAPRRDPDGAARPGRFGPLPYMAPELLDAGPLGAQRSAARDVFAFGVIGWEVLADGHPTGLGHKAGAGVYLATYEHYRRGREAWPPRALEGRWGSVVAACLALDPAARPHDGGAILGLLDGVPQMPAPADVALIASGNSGARASSPGAHETPVIDGPTAPHVASDAAAQGPARSSTAPTAQLPAAVRPVDRTELAPGTSLPRAPKVDPTTPMVPAVALLSAPQSVSKTKPSPMAPERTPRQPEPSDRVTVVSATKGTWQAIALGLGLCALVVGTTAWLLLSSFGEPRPSPSPTLPAPTLPPPTLSPSPSAVASTAAPGEAATTIAMAAAAAMALDSGRATAPPIEVCCGSERKCSSGRPCSKGDCRSSPLPAGREFLLRLIRVAESIYEKDYSRNLADPGAAFMPPPRSPAPCGAPARAPAWPVVARS